MKLKLLLIALLLTAIKTFAQQPDTLRAKVYYTFTHLEDTTKKDEPRIENMVLMLGRNASVYTSMDRITISLDRMRQLQEQMKNATPGGNNNFKITSIQKRYSPIDYYQFANDKKLIINQRLVNNYLIEQPLPVINWKISNDTTTIAGLHCQKATAAFKGRDYTAWFCADLPFQSGPWKLNGLPGLIVEAYDTNKEVVFKLSGLEMVKDPGANLIVTEFDQYNPLLVNVVALPKDGVKTTPEEFNKLVKARNADPMGFINSSFAGSTSDIKITPAATKQGGNVQKYVLNNPIEKAP